MEGTCVYWTHGIDPDRRWMDWRVVDWVLAAGFFRHGRQRVTRRKTRHQQTTPHVRQPRAKVLATSHSSSEFMQSSVFTTFRRCFCFSHCCWAVDCNFADRHPGLCLPKMGVSRACLCDSVFSCSAVDQYPHCGASGEEVAVTQRVYDNWEFPAWFQS